MAGANGQPALPDSQRIVITGIGLTAPNGNNLTEFREALLAGRSGVSKYEIRYVGETLAGAGAHVSRLSSGKLRVESKSDSVEWILQLMQTHNLPPAEIVANPDALHELFIKSISGETSANSANGAPPQLDATSQPPPPVPTHGSHT